MRSGREEGKETAMGRGEKGRKGGEKGSGAFYPPKRFPDPCSSQSKPDRVQHRSGSDDDP